METYKNEKVNIYITYLSKRFQEHKLEIRQQDGYDDIELLIINPHWDKNIRINIDNAPDDDDYVDVYFGFCCHHLHLYRFDNISGLCDRVDDLLTGKYCAYQLFVDGVCYSTPGFMFIDEINLSTSESIMESLLRLRKYTPHIAPLANKMGIEVHEESNGVQSICFNSLFTASGKYIIDNLLDEGASLQSILGTNGDTNFRFSTYFWDNKLNKDYNFTM